ncbi:MAG: peptidylprolyl isomerase, partial [Bacteroidetes bacterium]
PAGDEVPGMIKQVGADVVKVDFNHPLAGHELVYRVKIMSVG